MLGQGPVSTADGLELLADGLVEDTCALVATVDGPLVITVDGGETLAAGGEVDTSDGGASEEDGTVSDNIDPDVVDEDAAPAVDTGALVDDVVVAAGGEDVHPVRINADAASSTVRPDSRFI